MRLRNAVVSGCALVVLGGCAMGEAPRQPVPSVIRVQRDIYAAERALPPEERAWEEASRRALRAGLSIAPSFRERIRFPAGEAHAIAYRFPLVRGQVLHVTIESADGGPPLRADVFQHAGSDIFRPVHTGRSDAAFSIQAQADGEYVLRLQPPVGMGGAYEVTVVGDRALRFPVADADLGAVGSVFGDARDGGVRPHEGVDIFAPRGTPVIAVADGWVRQSRNTPTGGLVIWQEDAERDLTYYYAHLDQLLVREGARVHAGDTIATVGNTGNARGTRPHLHFGVYRPGRIALDPAPLLAATAELKDVVYGSPLLGEWTHSSGHRVRLRSSPSLAGTIIAVLPEATPVLVLGDTGDWQRVVLTDGTTGFMAARFTPGESGSQR